MKDIFDSALQELRSRISDVKYTSEGISFLLDSVKYCGVLKGRNIDLVLGLSPEADHAIALRVLLDGDTNEMKWSDSQRAQLLQIYKDKITQLGEEEFFTKFDEIREEAYKAIGVDIEPVSAESIQAGYAPGTLTYKDGSLFPSELHPLDYIDPVHTAASTLGRLGGKARSKAKSRAVKENGKKGGRPSVKQLDLEEI